MKYAISHGEIVMDYPNDKPYPSKLIISIIDSRPIHVVYSMDVENNSFIVITAYEPSLDIWEEDYKTRKK